MLVFLVPLFWSYVVWCYSNIGVLWPGCVGVIACLTFFKISRSKQIFVWKNIAIILNVSLWGYLQITSGQKQYILREKFKNSSMMAPMIEFKALRDMAINSTISPHLNFLQSLFSIPRFLSTFPTDFQFNIFVFKINIIKVFKSKK